MKPTARFRVVHRNEDWMVCLPMNADASKVIHYKKLALWPKYNFGPDPTRQEEIAEILRKTEALCTKSN